MDDRNDRLMASHIATSSGFVAFLSALSRDFGITWSSILFRGVDGSDDIDVAVSMMDATGFSGAGAIILPTPLPGVTNAEILRLSDE